MHVSKKTRSSPREANPDKSEHSGDSPSPTHETEVREVGGGKSDRAKTGDSVDSEGGIELVHPSVDQASLDHTSGGLETVHPSGVGADTSVPSGSSIRLRAGKMVPQLSDDDTQELIQHNGSFGSAERASRLLPFKSKKGRRSSGATDDDEALYEQQQHGGGGGGEKGGGDGVEGRLLQTGDGRIRDEGYEEPEGESTLSLLMQVMLPFLVAGLGMVGAGLVLDMVQHWDVFLEITELFIMVPALLGLKGNLEMTLASRLSTHANMGHLDKSEDCISMIVGNLALIQCQAIVVGFLASVAAMVMGWIPEGEFNFMHAVLICAGALVTASFASFILGVIMVAVIMVARKCRINPDNVATPIAASLGDLTTLGLLSWIASLLFDAKGTDVWLAPVIIASYLCSLPLWIWLASRNKHTKEVLYSGWTPVISAMMISSLGGVILDYTVATYKGIAVYQPVFNGVGGNLVAVQASRISTALHLETPLGRLPRYAEKYCENPGTVFCKSRGHARTARVLLLLVIPGHLVFAYTISYLKAGHTSLTPIFVIVYLCAAMIQVVLLLYMSVVMVHWMWSVCIDPDNSAIPYLTAFGDLLGTGLLAIAFHLLYLVGDKDSDLGD
uniref:Solute carrier family 41 member 1-like isoform X2 n=2 Tax=Hirondellea gigas TaxID=1518452 RepID=A0A6A7FNJ2_9CRUS